MTPLVSAKTQKDFAEALLSMREGCCGIRSTPTRERGIGLLVVASGAGGKRGREETRSNTGSHPVSHNTPVYSAWHPSRNNIAPDNLQAPSAAPCITSYHNQVPTPSTHEHEFMSNNTLSAQTFDPQLQKRPTTKAGRRLFPPRIVSTESTDFHSEQAFHHHPQSHEYGPIHRNVSMATPNYNSPVFYLGTILHRGPEERWGLAISIHDSSFLVLGSVEPHTIRRITTWSSISQQAPPLELVFDPTNQSVTNFQRAFAHNPVDIFGQQQQQQQQQQHHYHHLLPGDVIVSLNGRGIASFPSLQAVTFFLRQTTTLTVVALRHFSALQQAQMALASTSWDVIRRENVAAQNSYLALRQVLDRMGNNNSGGITDWLRQVRDPSALFFSLFQRNIKGSGSTLYGKMAAIEAQSIVLQYNGTSTPPQLKKQQNKCLMKRAKHQGRGGQTGFECDDERMLRNDMFRNEDGEAILYEDNTVFYPDDGKRANEFLVPITSFPAWLTTRKATWRNRWIAKAKERMIAADNDCTNGKCAVIPARSLEELFFYAEFQTADRRPLQNPMFKDENGSTILFDDNDDFYPDDGTRAGQFLRPVASFPEWLTERKKTWRKRWNPRVLDAENRSVDSDDSSQPVSSDFWTIQGYTSFDDWLHSSKRKWTQSFSWNQRKRRKLQDQSEEVVHFPVADENVDEKILKGRYHKWLRVRKNQWQIQRRKRQRQKLLELSNEAEDSVSLGVPNISTSPCKSLPSVKSFVHASEHRSAEMALIDTLLEEEDLRIKELNDRAPIDLSFLFDANLGVPDDAVAHCLSYLPVSDHNKLFCISKSTSEALKAREGLWRLMCPQRWNLPRRPRKPWHTMYLTRMRKEAETSKKLSDELLVKASTFISKGDLLLKIERLVLQGEKVFGFDINYCSGVVLERNSLLNFATINRRHKIVRWLIEVKGANIETHDRGNFTPLMNAAWEGDKSMVRFLLGHGGDRRKLGRGHYSKPLPSPDFEGLNAEGWARRRGHGDVGDLIQLGL